MAVALVLIGLITIIGLSFVEKSTFQPEGGYPRDQQGGSAMQQQVERLKIYGSHPTYSWQRGSDDLPVAVIVIPYSISNTGNTSAQDVSLTCYLNGTVLRSESIGPLSPNETKRGNCTISEGEGTYRITLEARSARSSDSYSTTVIISYPREFSEEFCKFYITPNNPVVRSTLNNILANKPFYRTEFGAIQDWVDDITYTSDYQLHGVLEYWQFPHETIQLGEGDCEDFAILLCTLFRAWGIPANEVCVVLGEDAQGNRHAYLAEQYYYEHYYYLWDEWRILEPQEGRILISDFASIMTQLQFTDLYYFNDQYFGRSLPS
ncbi:MAG: transglutaminase-like cysteine peptidase [Candidatus Hadarchaeales archaeon]